MGGTARAFGRTVAIIGLALTAGAGTAPAAAGELTSAEQAAGWRLIFDGRTSDGWRGYRGEGFPSQGWEIQDGALHVIAGGGGGDIVTTEQYGDFELALEWKVAAGANSGIMYRVTERHDASWQTGPEFQVFDDAGEDLPPDDPHSAGALYDLYTPAGDKPVKPAGEWNTARIRLKDGIVQHFLNGKKVVEADMNSPEWKERIAASKFSGYEGFGVEPRGHIALQDHGNDVWYRNIRIRDLSKPMTGEQVLFNGKDLTGWTPVIEAPEKTTDTWSVEDGVLACTGQPRGYLRTNQPYANYVLKLEWRFDPESKGGNSGVLLRCGDDAVWPPCIEAQLESGAAGDLLACGGRSMKTDPARRKGIRGYRTHTAERPIGEWNEYEIVVDGDEIDLVVNGERLNHASDCEETAGPIALQSEGGRIQFRNIRLAEIK